MHRFWSYGTLDTKEHYYAPREKLIETVNNKLIGTNPEKDGNYITVWAPRQTGKSWLMQQILFRLEKDHRFDTAYIDVQELMDEQDVGEIISSIAEEIGERLGIDFKGVRSPKQFREIFKKNTLKKPLILIIDEFDSLNYKAIRSIASVFRKIYSIRRNQIDLPTDSKTYLLHSVALIGIRSVLGIENKQGSPFNVQQNYQIPNLSFEEVESLFIWYEKENKQVIEREVIRKIYEETSGQPGLTCWFGELLTETYNANKKKEISIDNFRNMLSAATFLLPNSNIQNIIEKVRRDPYKSLLLDIFHTDESKLFSYDNKVCNFLYLNGVIKPVQEGERFTIRFASPFLQSRLFNFFSNELFNDMGNLYEPLEKIEEIITPNELIIEKLLKLYKKYLDKNREWLFKDAPKRKDLRISEAVFHFNLYSYIFRLLEGYREASIYPEFPTGNGQVDLIIHYKQKTYGLELKTFRDEAGYKKALEQTARYGNKLGIKEMSLVFFIESIDDNNRKLYERPFDHNTFGVRINPFFIDTGVFNGRKHDSNASPIYAKETMLLPVQEESGMFVGRENELALIEKKIADNESKVGDKRMSMGQIFHIDGPGGIGKTMLAIESARRYAAYFKDGVLPPFRATELTPISYAIELAHRLNVYINEPTSNETAKTLISTLLIDRNLLIILDDMTNWKELSFMLPVKTPSTIIITTRNRDIYVWLSTNRQSFHVWEINLMQFTPGEALQLFKKTLRENYIEIEIPIYNNIAQILGYLPLAIRQALALMQYTPHYTAAMLFEKLTHENRLNLLRKGNAVEDNESRAIDAVFDLSSSILTPPLLKALQYISVCSPGQIPLSFLQILSNEADIGERMEGLYTYSWVDRIDQGGTRYYLLHQLVRELVKQKFNNPFSSEMISCVHKIFTDESIHFSIKDEYFFQLEEAFHLAYEATDERMKEWVNDLFRFCMYRGYVNFYIRMIEAVERLFPGDKRILKEIYCNRAIILREWGKLDEAMAMHKKEEEICQELGDRAGISRSYSNQAIILREWGKLDEAMAKHKKEEAICEELGDRAGISRSYSNQAIILRAWRKLDEAMAMHKKEEEICQELGDRAGISRSYSNQAIILREWGKLDEAMAMHKKEEEIYEELGDRAGLAISWWNQGIIYGQKKDHSIQFQLWQKTIDIVKSIGIPSEKYETALKHIYLQKK